MLNRTYRLRKRDSPFVALNRGKSGFRKASRASLRSWSEDWMESVFEMSDLMGWRVVGAEGEERSLVSACKLPAERVAAAASALISRTATTQALRFIVECRKERSERAVRAFRGDCRMSRVG